MEYRKGLIVTGMLFLAMVLAVGVVILLEWNRFVAEPIESNPADPESNLPLIIDIEREELTEYLEELGYVCEKEESTVDPMDLVKVCIKNIEEIQTDLTIQIEIAEKVPLTY